MAAVLAAARVLQHYSSWLATTAGLLSVVAGLFMIIVPGVITGSESAAYLMNLMHLFGGQLYASPAQSVAVAVLGLCMYPGAMATRSWAIRSSAGSSSSASKGGPTCAVARGGCGCSNGGNKRATRAGLSSCGDEQQDAGRVDEGTTPGSCPLPYGGPVPYRGPTTLPNEHAEAAAVSGHVRCEECPHGVLVAAGDVDVQLDDDSCAAGDGAGHPGTRAQSTHGSSPGRRGLPRVSVELAPLPRLSLEFRKTRFGAEGRDGAVADGKARWHPSMARILSSQDLTALQHGDNGLKIQDCEQVSPAAMEAPTTASPAAAKPGFEEAVPAQSPRPPCVQIIGKASKGVHADHEPCDCDALLEEEERRQPILDVQQAFVRQVPASIHPVPIQPQQHQKQQQQAQRQQQQQRSASDRLQQQLPRLQLSTSAQPSKPKHVQHPLQQQQQQQLQQLQRQEEGGTSRVMEALAPIGVPGEATASLGLDLLPDDAMDLADVVSDTHLLQFGALIGEGSARTMLAARASGGPFNHPCAFYGYADTDAFRQPWELLISERTQHVAYAAWRRPLRRGLYMYMTRTLYASASPSNVRAFMHDDAFRAVWDDATVEMYPSLRTQRAKLLGRQQATMHRESDYLVARVRFPKPMAARSYSYARRVWPRAVDGGCYVLSRACSPPGARLPSGRTVAVDDYSSAAVVRAASPRLAAAMGPERQPATEVLLVYFEDSQVRPGLANLGIRKGLWPQVLRHERALRMHQAQTSKCSPSVPAEAATRSPLVLGTGHAMGHSSVTPGMRLWAMLARLAQCQGETLASTLSAVWQWHVEASCLLKGLEVRMARWAASQVVEAISCLHAWWFCGSAACRPLSHLLLASHPLAAPALLRSHSLAALQRLGSHPVVLDELLAGEEGGDQCLAPTAAGPDPEDFSEGHMHDGAAASACCSARSLPRSMRSVSSVVSTAASCTGSRTDGTPSRPSSTCSSEVSNSCSTSTAGRRSERCSHCSRPAAARHSSSGSASRQRRVAVRLMQAAGSRIRHQMFGGQGVERSMEDSS